MVFRPGGQSFGDRVSAEFREQDSAINQQFSELPSFSKDTPPGPMRYTSLLVFIVATTTASADSSILAGVGIWDITGPPQDVNLMGMANPAQKAAGVLQRLRARAFTFKDTDPGSRPIAFVSLDAGMGSVVLKKRVIAALNKSLPATYDDTTVSISGTHTHSAPSGFLQNTIFQFAGSGWVPQTIDAYVDGTLQAILIAHRSMTAASVSVESGLVHNVSINRSPSAYLMNPAAERAKYASGDLSFEMVQLNIRSPAGTE